MTTTLRSPGGSVLILTTGEVAKCLGPERMHDVCRPLATPPAADEPKLDLEPTPDGGPQVS